MELGSKTLVVHVHIGNNTCVGCEPALVQATEAKRSLAAGAASTNQRPDDDVQCVGGVQKGAALTSGQKEKLRRMELKRMKKKYGLQASEQKKMK